MDGHCKQCGEPLIGRIDKKFCSDDCRSRHHHLKRPATQPLVGQINKILNRNHRILRSIWENGKKSIHRNILLEKGFSFEFYTHQKSTRSGKLYRYCYNYGYTVQSESRIRLTSIS